MSGNIPQAEIVVGVCTRNCEDTIQNVLRSVDEGLSSFFPGRKSLIIVSDLSEDSTRKRVEQTETRNPVFFTKQEGGPGKGNGIRTIFRLAAENGASVVGLVDGDLISIRPGWVKALVEPVDKGFDLAVPYYERHKYDSVITNHVVYPFVASMYGTEIRQPIGGEFGLSIKLVRKLLAHPKFPEGFGIDIFITTTAIVEDMRIAETALGVKSHTSTKEYKDFEKFLIPMFSQVVSTLFDLTLYNRHKIRRISGMKGVKRFGEIRGGSVGESVVDRGVLFQMFQKGYERIIWSDVLSEETKKKIREAVSGSGERKIPRGFWRHSARDVASYMRGRVERRGRVMRPDILSEQTKKEIREFIYGGSGQIISVDTWASAVFDSFIKYMNPSMRREAINVLRDVWLGRFSSFVRQTRFMDTGDAECMIRGQVGVFNKKKAEILSELYIQ
jgi:glycosyltransferase involved in cell wall biosynthesis